MATPGAPPAAGSAGPLLITVHLNTNQKESRPLQLGEAYLTNWKALTKAAKNKLGMKKKVQRIFTIEGEELDLSDKDGCPPPSAVLRSGDKICISAGEDFSGERRSKEDIAERDSILRLVIEESEVEMEAVKQLERVGTLPGVRYAVGMPDLHPGRGYPIGSAVASDTWIYPHLVGNDVGCGIMFLRTSMPVAKASPPKIADCLKGLDDGWSGDSQALFAKHGVAETAHDQALGTIGGGNHFAELQKFEHVIDPGLFEKMGLNEKMCHLLVHSGSRALGASIFDQHATNHKNSGFPVKSKECEKYLKVHDNAVKWAHCNRRIIAQRFLECIGDSLADGGGDVSEGAVVLDACHNNVIRREFSTLNPTPTNPVATGTKVLQAVSTGGKEGTGVDLREALKPMGAGDDSGAPTQPPAGPSTDAPPAPEAAAASAAPSDPPAPEGGEGERVARPKHEAMPEGTSQECLWKEGDMLYLHRKGAAPSDVGPVVIPGSRGHRSYLVAPIEKNGIDSAYSLAHGAGRRWTRAKAAQHGRTKVEKWGKEEGLQAMTETAFGSKVVCKDTTTLYEEQPEAYKNIDDIIHDLHELRLITVIATLTPLVTYKTRTMK